MKMAGQEALFKVAGAVGVDSGRIFKTIKLVSFENSFVLPQEKEVKASQKTILTMTFLMPKSKLDLD